MPEYMQENLETKHVGDEVHPGESVEEKISLSERFGLWVSFYPFAQDDYLAAVARWLAHFGRSPGDARRTASARARRCSSRCSAARARAASRGSSRATTPARARASRAIEGVTRPRRVAAAVILRPDGPVLLAQRPAGKPYAGYWEFPGGKLEPGETPAHASRASCTRSSASTSYAREPWLVQEFVYPHAHVELHFFRVFDWDGEPHGPRRPGVRVAAARRVHGRADAAGERTGIPAPRSRPSTRFERRRCRRGGVPSGASVAGSLQGCAWSSCAKRRCRATGSRAGKRGREARARRRRRRARERRRSARARVGCARRALTAAKLGATTRGRRLAFVGASIHGADEPRRAEALALDLVVLAAGGDAHAPACGNARLGRVRARRAIRASRCSRSAVYGRGDLERAGGRTARTAWR